MLEPSNNVTISRDENGASVNVGGDKVIKKLEDEEEESCGRLKSSYV